MPGLFQKNNYRYTQVSSVQNPCGLYDYRNDIHQYYRYMYTYIYIYICIDRELSPLWQSLLPKQFLKGISQGLHCSSDVFLKDLPQGLDQQNFPLNQLHDVWQKNIPLHRDHPISCLKSTLSWLMTVISHQELKHSSTFQGSPPKFVA